MIYRACGNPVISRQYFLGNEYWQDKEGFMKIIGSMGGSRKFCPRGSNSIMTYFVEFFL